MDGLTNSRHPAEHDCNGEAVSRREVHTHEDHARREVRAHQHRNENRHDFWRYRKTYTKAPGSQNKTKQAEVKGEGGVLSFLCRTRPTFCIM